MPSLFDIAFKASQNGALEALKYFDTSLEITYKSDNTPVTIADKNTEKIIRDTILSFDKNAKFVGEEGGGDLKEKNFWIIDPIDGTRSFSRGIPLWRILVGYIEDGKPKFGLSYDPVSKNLLWGEKGKGAFFNDKKCKVSSVSDLSKAYLYYGNPKYFPKFENLIELIKSVQTARSTDIGNQLLATGKIDVLIDPYGRSWDIAPYKVIIEESGGMITNRNGEEWKFDDIGCVASNGLFHKDVIKILNK